jgi:hypothetical protein
MARGPSGWQMLNHPFAAIVYVFIVLAGLILLGMFAVAFAALFAVAYGVRWAWARLRR